MADEITQHVDTASRTLVLVPEGTRSPWPVPMPGDIERVIPGVGSLVWVTIPDDATQDTPVTAGTRNG
jgi:hypothetical protein